MADNVLSGAEARRTEIGARLKALAEEKARLDAELAQVNTFIEQARAYAEGRTPTVTPRGRNSSAEVMAAIIRVIGAAGKPLQLSDIHGRLEGEGVTLTGKDPTGALSTILWRGGRDGALVNIKGAGYWDARKPYAPAGFKPSKAK